MFIQLITIDCFLSLVVLYTYIDNGLIYKANTLWNKISIHFVAPVRPTQADLQCFK